MFAVTCSVLLRIFACLLLWGGGAVALAPACGWKIAVTVSATVAFAVNAYWRDRQRRRLARELREAVAREEAMRDGRA